MLKYCRECVSYVKINTAGKARGRVPSALFRVKHKQGNALTIKNFREKYFDMFASLL